jgi:hypothetical protein
MNTDKHGFQKLKLAERGCVPQSGISRSASAYGEVSREFQRFNRGVAAATGAAHTVALRRRILSVSIRVHPWFNSVNA